MPNPEKTKRTLAETRQRRKTLVPRVFKLKIDESKLSCRKRQGLDTAFRETKWIQNAAIASGDIFGFTTTPKSVTVMTFNEETQKCDIPVVRDLESGSHIRQSAVNQVKQDVVNLAKKKSAAPTASRSSK